MSNDIGHVESEDYGVDFLYRDIEPFEENKKLVMKYWVWRAFHPECHVCLYCKRSRFTGRDRTYGCMNPTYYYIEKEPGNDVYVRKACLRFLSEYDTDGKNA